MKSCLVLIISGLFAFTALADEKSVYCKNPESDLKFKMFNSVHKSHKYTDEEQAKKEALRRSKNSKVEQLQKKLEEKKTAAATLERDYLEKQERAGKGHPDDAGYPQIRAARDEALKKFDEAKIAKMDVEDELKKELKKQGGPIWYEVAAAEKEELKKKYGFECSGQVVTSISDYVHPEVIDGDLEEPVLEHKASAKELKNKAFSCVNGGVMTKGMTVEEDKVTAEVKNDVAKKKLVFQYPGVLNAGNPKKKVFFGTPHAAIKTKEPGYMYNSKKLEKETGKKGPKRAFIPAKEVEFDYAGKRDKKVVTRTLENDEPTEVVCENVSNTNKKLTKKKIAKMNAARAADSGSSSEKSAPSSK